MFTFRRFGGLLIVMLLVAACTGTAGSGNQTNGDQFATSTPAGNAGAVITDTPAPPEPVDTAGIAAGQFKATVSGSEEGDWEGDAMATTYAGRSGTTLTFVAMSGGSDSYGVLIEVPADTAPGTYPLGTYIEAFADENTISKFGAQFSNAGTNSLDLYTTVTSGTLILSEVEPALTGRFEFTATDDDKTVNVVGTFNQVEVKAMQ